ncbi:MAG: branched-chain amino acid ABC transporter permease, partial [Acidimicrobiia bacterium]|nr:branched-chain amino acid ABC transporter permease [Acidimicrobiia bacterium]
FATAVVFLSITIITGLGGQVSLATATFAAVGAFAVPHLFNDLDVPVIPAMFIGALAAAALGAIFVLLIDGLPLLIGKITGRPPTRLAGLYLSLATLAFALMMDKTVFRRESVIGGPQGIEVPRPDALNGDREWFLVVFAVFAIVGFFVILIRKGTTGKALAALRGSDPAAASIGINATSLRIKLFALSAGVAGLGGALLTLQSENANPNEVISLLGLVWVVLIVTLGSRTVDGAANAAIGFVVFAWLLEALGFQSSFAIVFFGLGAITYARHPEGVVEFQTRRSIVQTIRQRALGVRAKQLKSEGALPKEYRPVRAVSLPVLIGPALYFAYIVIGSVFEDGWLSVRSPTILFFIVPSLVFGLAWMFVTCLRLERDGGVRFGWLRLVAGGVVGGLLGVWFDSKGWPLRGSLADCVLVGIPAGIAVVGFFLLPVNVQRIVKARNWLTTPIAWQAGRAPALFVLFGAFLFQRTIRTGETSGSVFETGAAPSGWPVFFVVCVFVIVWVQWVAGVQAAVNELAIGGEGFVPPEGKAYVAEREAAAPAPTGGAE